MIKGRGTDIITTNTTTTQHIPVLMLVIPTVPLACYNTIVYTNNVTSYKLIINKFMQLIKDNKGVIAFFAIIIAIGIASLVHASKNDKVFASIDYQYCEDINGNVDVCAYTLNK